MTLLESRRSFSSEKIRELKKEIKKLSYIKDFKNSLCIYVTGSFAREEASPHSDIDIFFIYKKKNKLKNLQEIMLKADLIRIMRKLNLPDFSGDGEYLTIHCLEDIIAKLGSPEDDYKNYFTARLLLLLESKPLYNEKIYNKAISDIIDVYFNDYPDHMDGFSPKFFANDVIRFWKTMCLNYEQKRNIPKRDEKAKLKAKLKNLKLKFSRLTTCYSLLCCLRKEEKVTPQDLRKLIDLTPLGRLKHAPLNNIEVEGVVNKMLNLYEWFLITTGVKTSDAMEWFKSTKNQKIANENAEKFHDLFYQLIESTSKDLLKFYTL